MPPAILQLASVVLHTVALYVFLVLALGLLGHRQISELSATELLIVMVLGSAVETAMVAGDTSLLAGLVSAATLLVSNHLLTLALRRWERLRRLVVGHPIPLVYKGHFIAARIREAGLTEDDVREGIRERGYDRLDQVRLAVLEIDGEISVVTQNTSTDQNDPSSEASQK